MHSNHTTNERSEQVRLRGHLHSLSSLSLVIVDYTLYMSVIIMEGREMIFLFPTDTQSQRSPVSMAL